MILFIYHAGATKLDNLASPPIKLDLVDFLFIALRSAYLTNPTTDVLVIIINGNEQLESWLMAAHPSVNFRHLRLVDPVSFADLRMIEFEALNSLLGQAILHCDIDVLFRSDISALMRSLNDYEVASTCADSGLDRDRINCGIMGYGPKSLRFLSWLRHLADIFAIGDPWYGKQSAAFELYQAKTFDWLKLPAPYNDGYLLPDGHIWHAHRKSKAEKLERFRRELVVLEAKHVQDSHCGDR